MLEQTTEPNLAETVLDAAGPSEALVMRSCPQSPELEVPDDKVLETFSQILSTSVHFLRKLK